MEEDWLAEQAARKIALEHLDPAKLEQAVKLLTPVLEALHNLSRQDPEFYEQLRTQVRGQVMRFHFSFSARRRSSQSCAVANCMRLPPS